MRAASRGCGSLNAADSHGHNDYLSGLSELHTRTGAQLWGSAAGELGYAHRALEDGEIIEIGEVGVEVLHTPGHTPEHISLCANPTSGIPATSTARPLAVTCGSGYRSSVSASLLAQHGQADVVNVAGGMTAWNNA